MPPFPLNSTEIRHRRWKLFCTEIAHTHVISAQDNFAQLGHQIHMKIEDQRNNSSWKPAISMLEEEI